MDDATYPNIGDRLSAADVSWAWYSGGWDDAEAGHPGPLFQYHHQPFNYFAAYAPGQPGRAHLQDETKFLAAAKNGTLPTVSFVKPYGAENEHPGYASEPNGSDHLVDLIKAVQRGPQAKHTVIVVTYDEFGGQWDHVSPPGPGSSTPGAHDAFGPGTRIPALVLGASFRHSGVDHTSYDTTSIMASIERALGLQPVSSRDAQVADLGTGPADRRGPAQPPLTSPETFSRQPVRQVGPRARPEREVVVLVHRVLGGQPDHPGRDDVEHVLEPGVDPDGHRLPGRSARPR